MEVEPGYTHPQQANQFVTRFAENLFLFNAQRQTQVKLLCPLATHSYDAQIDEN